MLPTFGLPNHQNVLEMNFLFVRRRRERRIDGWRILRERYARQGR